MNDRPTSPADAAPNNWVDRFAPSPLRPYLRLMRADRLIGVWLLMWPAWMSAALAAGATGARLPDPWHLFLFFAGALVMRGAGCAYNDVIDKDYDAKVERTASRPVASGQISLRAAWIFLVALSLIGFVILIQFNLYTIILGIGSLALIAAYPFMKRITYWPQAWLGLTFNWGALVGWAAAEGSLNAPALALYAGCVAWTLGYDTIYAHQDKEDDALIGVRSTALKFGAHTKTWLSLFYGAALGFWAAAGFLANLDMMFFAGLAAVAVHLLFQISQVDIDKPERCLSVFKSNHLTGALIFAAILIGSVGGVE